LWAFGKVVLSAAAGAAAYYSLTGGRRRKSKQSPVAGHRLDESGQLDARQEGESVHDEDSLFQIDPS
jgi:hypothetical protein